LPKKQRHSKLPNDFKPGRCGQSVKLDKKVALVRRLSYFLLSERIVTDLKGPSGAPFHSSPTKRFLLALFKRHVWTHRQFTEAALTGW
jgi:hypothetical protein